MKWVEPGSARRLVSVSGTTPASTALVRVFRMCGNNPRAAAFGVSFRRIKVEPGSTPSLYSQEADFDYIAGTYLPKSGGTLTGPLYLPFDFAGIELGNPKKAQTPFIDFHSSGNDIDFDVRLIASGGDGAAGKGTLDVVAGATKMSGDVIATGNITAFSDERLKTDWAELPDDFINRLAQVRHGTFTRTDTGARQVGVGAQSLRGVLPEAVHDGEVLSVAYGNAALAAAVKLARECVALRERVNALERQITARGAA